MWKWFPNLTCLRRSLVFLHIFSIAVSSGSLRSLRPAYKMWQGISISVQSHQYQLAYVYTSFGKIRGKLFFFTANFDHWYASFSTFAVLVLLICLWNNEQNWKNQSGIVNWWTVSKKYLSFTLDCLCQMNSRNILLNRPDVTLQSNFRR